MTYYVVVVVASLLLVSNAHRNLKFRAFVFLVVVDVTRHQQQVDDRVDRDGHEQRLEVQRALQLPHAALERYRSPRPLRAPRQVLLELGRVGGRGGGGSGWRWRSR